MANKLVNIADVILAKSERAQTHLLKLIDVRNTWAKWGKLDTALLMKIYGTLNVCSKIRMSFATDEWRSIRWVLFMNVKMDKLVLIT